MILTMTRWRAQRCAFSRGTGESLIDVFFLHQWGDVDGHEATCCLPFFLVQYTRSPFPSWILMALVFDRLARLVPSSSFEACWLDKGGERREAIVPAWTLESAVRAVLSRLLLELRSFFLVVVPEHHPQFWFPLHLSLHHLFKSHICPFLSSVANTSSSSPFPCPSPSPATSPSARTPHASHHVRLSAHGTLGHCCLVSSLFDVSPGSESSSNLTFITADPVRRCRYLQPPFGVPPTAFRTRYRTQSVPEQRDTRIHNYTPFD